MSSTPVQIDWEGLINRPAVRLDRVLLESVARERAVLITGAGGSIGSSLARRLIKAGPRKLLLLDSSENALYEIYRELVNQSSIGSEIVPVVGNITRRRFVAHLLQSHKVDIVLHAAAYKHVPLMEQNPFSAMHNNAIGTYRLVSAAVEAKVSSLVLVSTDKAVNPLSVMGSSKRIAELVVLAPSGARMNAVRLGNVLGSSGSVAPLFAEQARLRIPLTVTHPDAERFFLTWQEADLAILQSAASSLTGKIFIPDCGVPVRIVSLAEQIAQQRGLSIKELGIKFIGLRPGDKLREQLVSPVETIEPERSFGMQIVQSPAPKPEELAFAMNALVHAIRKLDEVAMSQIVSQLVPGYQLAGVPSRQETSS